MKTLITSVLLLIIQSSFAQTVTNGSFTFGSIGWGCNPEVNTENAYGGSSSSNNVAEIDAEAQLCQTISGFVPGAVYRLKFNAARRTNCGPTLQTINISISNGALAATVSRNGTAFSMSGENLQFTATSTTHTLSFATSLPGTCNMLVDNITIQLVSGLPVEFLDMTATPKGKTVELDWATASELRNDHFTIERSADAKNWEAVTTVKGTGTTTQRTDYTLTDAEPIEGVSYYRLSQTDMDGTSEELKVISVTVRAENTLIAYPNPAADVLTVSGIDSEEEILILDASGRAMPFSVTSAQTGTAVLDITDLQSGNYLLKTATGFSRFIKK